MTIAACSSALFLCLYARPILQGFDDFHQASRVAFASQISAGSAMARLRVDDDRADTPAAPMTERTQHRPVAEPVRLLGIHGKLLIQRDCAALNLVG